MHETHSMTRKAYLGDDQERVGSLTVFMGDDPPAATPIYLMIEAPRNALSASSHLSREDATWLRDTLTVALDESAPSEASPAPADPSPAA